MARKTMMILIFAALSLVQIAAEEELQDFDFMDSYPEIMIAQESRQYQTIVKPPLYTQPNIKIVKPNGITNSHRPQYNIDSEEDFKSHRSDDLVSFYEATTKRNLEKAYHTTYKLRSKEGMIREAVLRALERKDHVGKFAQILPIIRSMSGNQRVALASLVASQVTTPPGRSPLNLAQVRSMFGNNQNTSSELMLPILLDMANLIRKAVRPGKETRDVRQPQTPPHPQMLRRSDDDDTYLDDEPFETFEDTTTSTTKAPKLTTIQSRIRGRNRVRNTPQHKATNKPDTDNTVDTNNAKKDTDTDESEVVEYKSTTKMTPLLSSATTESISLAKSASSNVSGSQDNATMDLTADATNQTLVDLPVAEKLRAYNRYLDRNGNLIRRGNFPKTSSATRRSTPEPNMSPMMKPNMSSLNIKPNPPVNKLNNPVNKPNNPVNKLNNPGNKQSNLNGRRRPAPARKLPNSIKDEGKCELFTNSLCLHMEDYPMDLIIQSIRRNKAAAGALLADFRDPGDGAVDGVTAAQEAKYTADHYLVSNRRGDTANRDFAGAGEAGFMCPSTVKYARPQRARATSGQWKYIVNTGEHTQTLRLEKCLKPKESCTYLTDNFKSKCVQVYNYHRLLTWDQQNGLHMDIFKVPTCCSCHIEGYSVAFPPLGHRIHETSSSSEQFPGEDLSAEHGNGAFESIQPSLKRPSISKNPPFSLKPLDNFPGIGEHHNLISSAGFPKVNLDDNEGGLQSTNPMDSYGNSYFPDSFNQASNIRNIKRPPTARNPNGASNMDDATLPSYLEPPTPSSPSSFSFVKEPPSKYKITNSNQFKRGAPRPQRRPIRKTISGAPDDLMSSGTAAMDTFTSSNVETLEDFNDDLEEPEIITKENQTKKVTIAPKLPAVELSTTSRPEHQKPNTLKDNTVPNGKRVNYNYHPIIDFFEEDKDDDSIDREDLAPAFALPQSEWKPIDHPVSRNTNNNLVGRKKHK